MAGATRYLKMVGARASNLSVSEHRRIEAAVRRSAAGGRVVLAVSGGRDSMALLHAASRALDPREVMVATLDHATGRFATRAAGHVACEAARRGLPVVAGRASADAGTEAGWRAARHEFLGSVAERFGGRVMTAHTRDDQVETVLMRVLRDSGARGLAGLYARSSALRPLLPFSREEVADYARDAGVRWLDDPTNQSGAHLRNRVRRDLLPALARVAPDLDATLVDLSREAAELRQKVDAWAETLARVEQPGRHGQAGRRVSVDGAIAGFGRELLALLWPAIAARVGLAMDWRGTARAAEFTGRGKAGASVPLSGGWRIARSRDGFELHRAASAPEGEMPLAPGLEWQEWRFTARPMEQRAPAEGGGGASDSWKAPLPESGASVRVWRPGDRMRVNGRDRRVKRFLSDAGISGEQRARWPVVLVDDEIVWIPGVRRSDAAAVRPGRPGMLYRCDCDRH